MTTPGSPRIDVLIVNYRTGPLVVACLESLAAERIRMPHLSALIVDNACPDASADFIDAAIEANGWTWATVIRSSVNGGFGAGNNLGIANLLARENMAELVWLLNPDTRVSPGSAVAIARFMADHPEAAIAGTAILEGNGRPWPFAFRFPTILGEIERGCRSRVVSRLLARNAVLRRMSGANERVDWVSGASVVVRRQLFEQGLRFDEGYFLYFEETDFCLAAARQGLQCWYVPAAVVTHLAGQSTGVTAPGAGRQRLPNYWFASRQRYFMKNHGILYGLVADIAWLLAHLLFKASGVLRRAGSDDRPLLGWDFLRQTARFKAWIVR